jgi:hypothetical protein
MMRILDKLALSAMALGLFLLLFPFIRITEWLSKSDALQFMAKMSGALASPITFKVGFFLTLVATIAHIFTSHMVKPKEPAS